MPSLCLLVSGGTDSLTGSSVIVNVDVLLALNIGNRMRISSVRFRAPMCTMRVAPADKLQVGMQMAISMRRPSFIGVDDAKPYTRAINGGVMRIQTNWIRHQR